MLANQKRGGIDGEALVPDITPDEVWDEMFDEIYLSTYAINLASATRRRKPRRRDVRRRGAARRDPRRPHRIRPTRSSPRQARLPRHRRRPVGVQLAEARRIAGEVEWPKWLQADFRELPFEDESFDAVLCLFTSIGYRGEEAIVRPSRSSCGSCAQAPCS